MLLLLSLIAVALWPVFGAAAALAFLCLGLVARHLYDRRKRRVLERWLRNPSDQTLPQARGEWGSVFYYLARLMRLQSQTESRLAVALERFQQAGAAMPEGMLILDDADRIEWCNPRAELHFGIELDRDAGQQVTYLVRSPQFHDYLRAPDASEPLVLRLSRNLDVTLSVHLIPFGDKQKLVISRDITRWEKLETMRRDFIANVSHELRTPLTVVMGVAENMLDLPDLPQNARRPMRLMEEQARRMQRLVEDLLTLSRLESADNPPRAQPVDVPQLVRSLHQDALTLSAGRHRILLLLESGAWLSGSEDELRSAFGNLVSNAVRYTPEGGEITLAWQQQGAHVAFVVQDSGIGIEAQHIARLTERFYRVDRSRSRETGGTGLGLAIVKHVLNRHQARLDIVSEPGRGSRFSATFPAQRVINAPAAAELTETAA